MVRILPFLFQIITLTCILTTLDIIFLCEFVVTLLNWILNFDEYLTRAVVKNKHQKYISLI